MNNQPALIGPQRPWNAILRAWTQPKVAAMLFFGFSAGLPLLLIFSSLSLWLREAGINRETVTFFSWAALAYSFKFVWAPLVDSLPLPYLTVRLGRRRGWLLAAQTGVIFAICLMALTDPAAGRNQLVFLALAAVLLGFSSATQDIVIDALRIEWAEADMQALLSSTYIAGYRMGMLAAGAGALYLASWFGSDSAQYSYQAWRASYLIMAGCMLGGLATTLLIAEPAPCTTCPAPAAPGQYLRFLVLFLFCAAVFAVLFFATGPPARSLAEHRQSPLVHFLIETGRLGLALASALGVARLLLALGLADKRLVRQSYLAPISDFFHRHGTQSALLLLALIGLYRISDIILGVISTVFYQDLGFSKPVIASVIKTFGLAMTLAGGFLGGTLTLRYGVLRMLLLGALLSSLTNLLFLLLAKTGNSIAMLTLVIGADNLSAGIATTAFVAFLSSLTNVSFTAMQYALFSSLMTLVPKLLGGYSGTMVSAWGYPWFFVMTTLAGLPVLLLIWLIGRKGQVRGREGL